MKAVICSMMICALALSSYAQAEPRAHIRFYKANKQMQEDRIMFVRKKGSQAGCHNFVKSVRVHRVNQIGFKSCRLFAKKNCSSGQYGLMDKDGSHSNIITQGKSWYPAGKEKRGEKAKSWECEK